jgi:uncharacterized protein
MLKLLLLLLAVWVVLTILKQRRPPSPKETKTGNMVRCALCGVHLPESEAIFSSGRHYCSETHFLQRDQS